MGAHHNDRGSIGLNRAIEGLRSWSLFSDLNSAELGQIVDLIRARTFEAGRVIAQYGGQDANLYLVRSGRVVVRRPSKSYVDAPERVAEVGDRINVDSWLTGQANDFMAEALDTSMVWTISREDFLAFLEANPAIKRKLNYPEEVRKHYAELEKYHWLQPGELLIKLVRKHWWVFFRSAWLSWLLFLILTAVLVVFGQTIAANDILRGITIATFLLALANLGWQLVDWLNDFYAVTDRRVIHQERVVFFSLAQDESPLDRIQDITVEQMSLPAVILGIGDVIISQTGSDTKIEFRSIADPFSIGQIVAQVRQRYKIGDVVQDHEKIREDLRPIFEVKALPSDVPGQIKLKSKKLKTPLDLYRERVKEYRQFRNTVLPYSRLIEGDNIIYRKHWLQLVRLAWLPALLTAAFTMVLVIIFLAAGESAVQALSATPVLMIILIIIGSVLLIWLAYEYEDWRNDIYVLTKKSLIDIDRRPFGLATKRRETTLDKVQTVSAKTQGIIDSFFNVGDVVITTGSTEQLTFLRVADPESVQADVSKRMEDYKRTLRDEEAQKRRNEFVEWFHQYHEMSTLGYEKKKPA